MTSPMRRRLVRVAGQIAELAMWFLFGFFIVLVVTS